MTARTHWIAVLQFVAVSAMAVTIAAAQTDTTVRTDDRWRPFLGCWATASSYNMLGPTVCVVPTTDANIVEFVSVVRDSIIDRTLVGALGYEHASRSGNCTASDSVRWSLDQRRLTTRDVVTCGGSAVQQGSSLYTVTRPDAFTRVESTTAGGITSMRALTFTALGQTPALPLDVEARLPIVNDNGVIVARGAAAAEVKQNRKALRDAGVSRRLTQALLAASSSLPSQADDPSAGVATAGPCAHYRGSFSCSRYTPGGNEIGDVPSLIPPGSSRTSNLLGYETTPPRGIP